MQFKPILYPLRMIQVLDAYGAVCEVQKNMPFYISPNRANHACLVNSVQSKAFLTFGQFCPELSIWQRLGKNKNEDYALIYKVNLHFYKKADV